MMEPLESVWTFTLNWVSTSVAPRITTSRLSTAALFPLGEAYCMAETSLWFGLSRMDSTAFRSKHWTSSSLRKQPACSISTI